MIKGYVFKILTPITCILATAFAPITLSANQYYNNNSGCCEQPCQQDPCCQPSCGTNWGVFAGAAAVGAIAGVVAGVVAANSNKSHHHSGTGTVGDTGPTGPAGATGATGATGAAGAGFTVATVPPGQPGAGAAVTSLTFTFTTLVALSLLGSAVQTYVTTPDGRTILGSTLTGLLGSTGTVTIPTGPFYSGNYDVGVILPASLISLAGLVRVEITNINGTATSPALDDAGIVIGASVLALTTDTFYNAQYPFPETP